MVLALGLAHGNAAGAEGAEPETLAAPPTIAANDSQPRLFSGFNGDLDLYSGYTERGLSYSRERPSLQARFEYDFISGPYAGLALADKADVVDKETLDIDPYAGYRVQLHDWIIDAGVFSWLYVHSRFDVSRNGYDTVEATVDVTYKMFGVRLWYDLENYWGLDSASAAVNYHLKPKGSTRGSSYVDAHLSLPLPQGFAAKFHAGHQFIRNYGELDYTDWLISLERTFGHGVTVGAGFTDTNADESLYADSRGIKLGRGKSLAYIRWAFP
ncbi:MAG: hypothetical protein JWN43_4383 [Gammaproteobacteria bacterium]|nr:hypothetical protein [Gammaproteobacteria bacterium]